MPPITATKTDRLSGLIPASHTLPQAVNADRSMVERFKMDRNQFDGANRPLGLCVDGPGLARVVLAVIQVGRVRLCVRPVDAIR